MQFRTRTKLKSRPSAKQRRAGFTLAEVLAALLFMAIVIPVAVEGLRIASRAGEVAQRKGLAMRVAERVLNEIVVTEAWSQSALGGMVEEGPYEFEWMVVNEPWERDTIRQLSVQVIFHVQNHEHTVSLSTLLDSAQQYEQSQTE
jgi:type II secretory pathway component PulJ